MMFADVMVAHLAGRPAADLARREADVRRFMTQFGPVSDDAWTRLKRTPLLARPDAPAAAGPFPLIIGSLRPLSTAVTNEYLASHGYVVAMVDGEETPEIADPGAGLDVDYRDMEFAIPELRKRPEVDGAALGALGFSGSGFSQVLLAMRHPDVDAVCDLESAIFDDRMMFPLSRGWGYDTAALRVPFLHTYSVPLSRLENRIGDFEAMRYSTRYRYLVDAPGIHHWDFATEGMAASAVLGVRGPGGPGLQQAFEMTNRYVLQFFNAYVKHDPEGVAFLRRDPQANGAPAGLLSVREYPAIQPAPSLETIEAMVRARGIEAAVREFDAARAIDPQAAVFREASLNRLGYRLLRGEQVAESLVIFRKVVALFPGSANAYDSLSEALEAAGERAQSVEVAQKGLDVLSKQDLTADRKRELANLLEARLERLR
jgi:tetratricopeptide (TPR) repeat protein